MVSTIYDHTDPPNSQTLYLSAIADVTGYPETDADDPGYYRQMRKFGCNILAVVQQYDVIKNSPVRAENCFLLRSFLQSHPGHRTFRGASDRSCASLRPRTRLRPQRVYWRR